MTPEEVGRRMVALLTGTPDAAGAAPADAPAAGDATEEAVAGVVTGEDQAAEQGNAVATAAVTTAAGDAEGVAAEDRPARPGAAPPVAAEVSFGQVTVDVPADRWVRAHELVRDHDELGCDFFDWLSAYEQPPAAGVEPAFVVVSHLWSVEHRHSVLLRTTVPAADPRIDSVTGVFRGADWHERETFEMFGVVFEGHPMLLPLLLPDGFVGHPLRKDFVLAARVAKQWPGGKDPDEPKGGGPSRRKVTPPGVPAPDDWAPDVPR